MTSPSRAAPSAVVFDVGGVLIDWNPRHLFRTLFEGDDEAMERFLDEVCSPEWNAAQDAGRSWSDAVRTLTATFPDQSHLIEAYDLRWMETVGGAIEGTVAVLGELHDAGVPLYALSNWSAEKFALVRQRYPFLDWFDGLVVSGDVGLVKPDPRIYRFLFERFAIEPGRSVFVDDNAANLAAGEALGLPGLLFSNPTTLRADLATLGLLT